MKYNPIYLINTSGGHNKFYDMYPNDEKGMWIAVWGKIGTNGQTKVYPMRDFYKKLDEKLNKGYYEVDSSHGSYDDDELIREMTIMME